jgi:hypothetical protein
VEVSRGSQNRVVEKVEANALRQLTAIKVTFDRLAYICFQFGQVFSLGGDSTGLIRRVPARGEPTTFFIAFDCECNFPNVHDEIMHSPRRNCKPAIISHSNACISCRCRRDRGRCGLPPQAGQSSQLFASSISSGPWVGQSCSVAGSKSAPFGQTMVRTSGSMRT